MTLIRFKICLYNDENIGNIRDSSNRFFLLDIKFYRTINRWLDKYDTI